MSIISNFTTTTLSKSSRTAKSSVLQGLPYRNLLDMVRKEDERKEIFDRVIQDQFDNDVLQEKIRWEKSQQEGLSLYDLSPSFGAERSSAHIHAGVERDRVVSKRDQSEAGTLMSRTGSVLSSVLLRRRADSASVAPSDSASALGRPSIPPFLEAGSLYLSVPPTPSRGSVVSVSALPLTANAGARFGSSSLSVPLNVKLVRESADPLASLPATRAGSTSSLFPGHPQARHGEKDTLPPRSRAASVVGESALRGLPASRMMSMSSLRPDDPFQGAFPYVLSRGDSGMSSTRSSLK